MILALYFTWKLLFKFFLISFYYDLDKIEYYFVIDFTLFLLIDTHSSKVHMLIPLALDIKVTLVTLSRLPCVLR